MRAQPPPAIPIPVPSDSSIVAVYLDYASAEQAVRLLHTEGVSMTDLSIVGRDFRVSEEPIGFVNVGAYAAKGAETGARGRLGQSPYSALSEIDRVCRDGVATLRGYLPSQYLKQIAHETVAGIEGIAAVVNDNEVIGAGAADAADGKGGPPCHA